MSTIILTGGGTAGHVVPSLALLPELRNHFDKIIFIGGNGIEKELAEKANIPFYSTPVIKFDRSNFVGNIKIPFVLGKGIREAKKLLSEFKPDAVFSKGGYASLPTCFAAKSLGVPIIVHESDYTLGLANKIVSKFAASCVTSFEETEGGKFIGNPVRKEILHGNKAVALSKFPINPQKETVLVFGGSMGAEAINNVIYKGLNKITKKYNVIHISGKSGDFSRQAKDYWQLKFTDDMASLYAISDVVVSRGGANTLAELACLGKKSIIIPLPKGNSRGDQLDNATSYKKRGFIEILLQEELFVETLMEKIDAIQNKSVPILDVTNISKGIVCEILKAIKSS